LQRGDFNFEIGPHTDVGKKPFDATAWRMGLEEYRDIPFMEDGRDQGRHEGFEMG
jgi:hypothetical protein